MNNISKGDYGLNELALVERYADNGAFSHYELIDLDTGKVVWPTPLPSTAGVMKWVKIDNEKDLPSKEFDGPTRSMSINGKWIYHNKSREELMKLLHHELELQLEWLDDQSPAAIDKVEELNPYDDMPGQ